MYFFVYVLKTAIRTLFYSFRRKKILLIAIIIILVLLLLKNNTFAVYTGNDDYTDNNNTINIAYNSICSDFIFRLDRLKNLGQYDALMTYLNDKDLGYYIYYNDFDGTSMLNGSTYLQDTMLIAFYDLSDPDITSSVYDNYLGMTCSVKKNDGIVCLFALENTIYNYGSLSGGLYMPSSLYNYKSALITNYLTDSSSANTNSVISAINQQTQATQQQTNTINQQTQVIQETQDFLTDDTMDEDEMTISTTGLGASDSNGVFNFLSSFMSSVSSVFTNIDNSVETISLPFLGGQSIVIRSDCISRYISNTPVYTIIQVFWWYYLGCYLVLFIKRMLEWLSTGELTDKGVSAFIQYLNKENAIIQSYMM